MDKLQPSERQKLFSIVMSLPEFMTGDANSIHEFLYAAGLEKFSDGLDLGSAIPRIKVTRVIKMLEAHGPLVEDPGYHALGYFLKYLLTIQELPLENIKFIAQLVVTHQFVKHMDYLEHLCQKYGLLLSVDTSEVVRGETSGNVLTDSDRLRQRRTERNADHRSATTNQYNRLNHDRILRDYDMTEQVASIKVAVFKSGPIPIIHQVIIGEPWLLNKYMFPRVIEELRHESSIRLELRKVSIAPTDLTSGVGLVVIEQRLSAIYSGLTLQTLFQSWLETHLSGCLLCIENQGIPSDQICQLARAFQSDVAKQLQSSLQQTGGRLIVCWINRYDVPQFELGQIIPAVERLNTKDVTEWFAARLREEDVSPSDVERCMQRFRERLAYSRGIPSTTYQAMEELLIDLAI